MTPDQATGNVRERADAFLAKLHAREHALVMGVLNVTPDSFSDGGRHEDSAVAIAAGERMRDAGADILDVGGESTRPGAAPVPPAIEQARIEPVVTGLAHGTVSIDTRRGSVARAGLAAGACVVNDVSGGDDPELLAATAESGAALILMHMRGLPATMQDSPRYDDVVAEIESFLLDRVARAEAAGVDRARILIDPGIGFGKTLEHNRALFAAVPRLAGHGLPLLLGVSRKSVLGAITGRPIGERGPASVAAAALAAFGGAAVVRVHDVAETRDAVRVAAAWSRPLIE